MKLLLRLAPLACSAASFLAANGSAADWPQWHGPTRDCVIPAGSPLPTALPKELKVAWTQPSGGGFSAPLVAGGKLFFNDSDGKDEFAHLLDAATGKEIWKVAYAAAVGDEFGKGPRATACIDGDRVFIQSMSGEFRCLNLKDGKVLWSLSFEKDYNTKYVGANGGSGTATRRGNNGSPVVDGDAVIIPVGATAGATLVACDKLTGKELWRSGNDEAAYSGVMVADIGGVRQIVHLNADALTGTDRKTGKQLWRTPVKTGAKRNTGTPVIFGDRVAVNSQTVGLVAFKISQSPGGWTASEDWVNKKHPINIATPVFVGDYLYSQGAAKDFICASAKTGETKWSQSGFGSGRKDYASTMIAGKNLLILTEDGTLVLVAANPEKYTELGRIQVCGNTWCFPAYADGKLYVRDSRQIACIDLAGK
jgi:outer membrane protein assembly factor BamB